MFAVAFGNNQTTSALLSSGADLGAVDDTAEDCASVFHLGPVVGLLLKNAKSSSTIQH
jgi:predicted heme/steroid binding protein